MKERYDVTVVGAGPAGLLAAKALAQNGFDVAVLERKTDPSAVTRACGQSLLPPNEYFFGDIFHYNAKDKRFCFSASGLSFPYTGPVKNLYNWHMFSPGMNKMQFGYGDEKQAAPIAVSYDKEILINACCEDLQCDHVDVFAGTEYTDMQLGPGGDCCPGRRKSLSKLVRDCGRRDKFTGCAKARLQQQPPAYCKPVRSVMLYYRDLSRPMTMSIITAVTFIDDKPVYLFLLPRPDGDEWNFIVLTLEGSVDLTAAYDRITKDSHYAAWFKGAKKTKEFAAIEYIYSPITEAVQEQCAYCGRCGSMPGA